MLLAVNYSRPLAELARQGRLRFDCFKCPAWEDTIAEAQEVLPVYVHFPFNAGRGTGTPVNREQNVPADWEMAARLLERTQTRHINIHLILPQTDYPEIPPQSLERAVVEDVVRRMVTDVAGAVAQWGAERVIVELGYAEAGHVRAAILPEIARRVTEETGCGFLLDVSHARLASLTLGMQPQEYIRQLPLHCLREMHITGTHRLEGELAARLEASPSGREMLRHFGGRWMDHMPLQEHDWQLFGWCMEQVHAGKWAMPDIVAFEYGGIRGFWEEFLEPNVLLEQIPRLLQLVRDHRG